MYEDRQASIKIDGKEYQLLMTNYAVKKIAGKYGGLDNLGEKLLSGNNFEGAIDEIAWLIALLANQPIMIYNLRNNANPKPLLTEDEILLLTTPGELLEFREALMSAMTLGAKRNVASEDNEKN